MKLAEILHRIVSPIALGIIFFGVITPMGVGDARVRPRRDEAPVRAVGANLLDRPGSARTRPVRAAEPVLTASLLVHAHSRPLGLLPRRGGGACRRRAHRVRRPGGALHPQEARFGVPPWRPSLVSRGHRSAARPTSTSSLSTTSRCSSSSGCSKRISRSRRAASLRSGRRCRSGSRRSSFRRASSSAS